MKPAIIVHGGAWDIPAQEQEPHRQGTRRAVEAGWEVLAAGGSALDAAEAAIVAGSIPPLLIVMPDNGWLANTTTSGPNSYEGFVLNELIPHVEATYRARSEAAGRAVGGLSRGGYWSLMMAFRRPDLFRSIGAHSPALIDSFAGPAEDPSVTLSLIHI